MHPYLILFVARVLLNHLKELRLYNHKQYDICKSRPRNKPERFNSGTMVNSGTSCISRDTINIHLNRNNGYDLYTSLTATVPFYIR